MKNQGSHVCFDVANCGDLLLLTPPTSSFCRYTIDWRTDMDRVFNIHSGNGSVYVLRELDREENAWHNISIMATEFSKSS